jgi:hypothetical protein
VIGKLPWLTENELPVTVKLEIWTGEELRLTSETLAVPVLPTLTEPKSTLLGLIWKAPETELLLATVDPLQPARMIGKQDAKRSARRRRPATRRRS